MATIEEFIEKMREAGLRVRPTHGVGDYYESSHEVSWDLCYNSATEALGDLGFDARFPADIDESTVYLESAEDEFTVEILLKPEYWSAYIGHIKAWLAGQYWTMA